MNRDLAYANHILDCVGRIQRYTSDGSTEFQRSTLIQDAVLRNLQTLAEATRRISDPLKARYPDAGWRQIYAFRNVVVHDYRTIDLDLVWRVVEQDLPCLREQIEAISRELGDLP